MTKRLRVIGMVAAALTILTGTVSAYSAETKSIKYKEFNIAEKTYVCTADTLEEFFEEEKITLSDGDKILLNDTETTDMETAIKTGDDIYIKRAFVVDVVIDGEKIETQVTGGQVKDIEKMYADKLGDNYEFKSKFTDMSPLRRDMELVFETTRQETESITQEIPFEVEYVENANLKKGTENVIQEGQNAVKTYTYVRTYVGGKYVDIKETCEIVKEPVNKIIEVGTKEEVTNSVDNIKYKKAIEMNASAYTAYCSGTKQRTATGAEAVKGVVAVDPSVIPLGTRVYVPGYGCAVAADTGGAIKGNKIDLCMNSYNEAIQWGRRNVMVYILE